MSSDDSQYNQSVTVWIHGLKAGQDEAVAALWNRYFQQLVRVAGRKLGGASRRVVDEEDIALTAFNSLCIGAAEGRFARLENRDDLWQILVALASRKAVDQIRRNVSQKRGGGMVRGDSIMISSLSDAPGGFEQFMSEEPTPDMILTVEEEYSRRLAQLDDDTLKQLAQLRLEGYSNEELAEKIGISLRSVERKLSVIRDIWTREIAEEDGV
jgi:DNA-directed RNA polymerase specialized sigma24 family protein